MPSYRVIEFASLDSTNRHAIAHLRELADGDVIQAGFQTAGRGRWDRRWFSDVPGNLCVSLVLKPCGVPATLPLANLSQLLAVSLCRVLEEHGIRPALKWPNDILISGRKIAGILAETVVEGAEFLGLVLGIGVNLNLTESSLALIDQPATSLNLLVKAEVSVAEFREALLGDFFSRYEKFLREGFRLIRAEYCRRCEFLGTEVVVRSPQSSWRGIAKDIVESGELELEGPDGQLQRVVLGEMHFAVAAPPLDSFRNS